MKSRQLLVEIPEHTKSWPMPWFADTIQGYNPIRAGKVKVGDYVFINDDEIHDIDHAAVFDEHGNPSKYEDSKSYAVFNVEGDYGDCVGIPVDELISVFRPKS